MLTDFMSFLRSLWREWSGPLGIGLAVAALWRLTTGTTVPVVIESLFIGISFLAAAFIAWRKEWIAAGRGFIEVPLSQLVNAYSGPTPVHATVATYEYLNKSIRLSGTVWSVDIGLIWASAVLNGDERPQF